MCCSVTDSFFSVVAKLLRKASSPNLKVSHGAIRRRAVHSPSVSLEGNRGGRVATIRCGTVLSRTETCITEAGHCTTRLPERLRKRRLGGEFRRSEGASARKRGLV